MSKKFIILFIVFVDVLGIGIVIPVLPFFVESFSNSPSTVTSLFAIFSLCAFFSAPVLGALSDSYGRRPILLISILSTAIGWLVFASAQSLVMLFLGRIIDGLAAGNLSTAQSYMADVSTNNKERTSNFGLIGVIFGLGFIIGPAIGGILGHIDHRLPFWFVGILALINLFLAYLYLPETKILHTRTTWKMNKINPFPPIKRAFTNTKLRPGFTAWFLFGVAVAIQQSVFALYTAKIFGFQEAVVGSMMTLVGVILIINQGFLLRKFWLKYFSEPKLEILMLTGLMIGFLLMATSLLVFFVLGLILAAFGQSVLRAVMTSQLASDEKSRGEILGMMTSIMSLSMIVGPFTSGWLFEINTHLSFLFAAIVLLIALLVLYTHRRYLKIHRHFAGVNPPVNL